MLIKAYDQACLETTPQAGIILGVNDTHIPAGKISVAFATSGSAYRHLFLTKEQALKLSDELKYVARGIDDPNFKPVEKKFSLSVFGPDSQRWYFYRNTPSGVFVTLDEALATDLREDEIEPAQEVLRKRGYTTFQVWDVVRD